MSSRENSQNRSEREINQTSNERKNSQNMSKREINQSSNERKISQSRNNVKIPQKTHTKKLTSNDIIDIDIPNGNHFEVKFLGFDYQYIPYREKYTKPDKQISPRLFFLLKLDNEYETMLGTKEEWLPFYVSSGNNSTGKAVGNVNPFNGVVSIFKPGSRNAMNKLRTNVSQPITEFLCKTLIESNKLDEKEYLEIEKKFKKNKNLFFNKLQAKIQYKIFHNNLIPEDFYEKNYQLFYNLVKYTDFDNDNRYSTHIKRRLNYADFLQKIKDEKPQLFIGLMSPTFAWLNKCNLQLFLSRYIKQALFDFTETELENPPYEIKESVGLSKICDKFIEIYNIKEEDKIVINQLCTNYLNAVKLFEKNPIPESNLNNKGRLCTKFFDDINSKLKNIFFFNKIGSKEFTGPQPKITEKDSKIIGEHKFRINTHKLKTTEFIIPIISYKELNDLIGSHNIYGINLNKSYNKNKSKDTFKKFHSEILKNNKDILEKNNSDCYENELEFKDLLDTNCGGLLPSISDVLLELLKKIKNIRTRQKAATKIQATFRSKKARNTKKKQNAAIMIEKRFRSKKSRYIKKKNPIQIKN